MPEQQFSQVGRPLEIDGGPVLRAFVDDLLARGVTTRSFLEDHVASFGDQSAVVEYRHPKLSAPVTLNLGQMAAEPTIRCPFTGELTPEQELTWFVRTLGAAGVLLEMYRPPNARLTDS